MNRRRLTRPSHHNARISDDASVAKIFAAMGAHGAGTKGGMDRRFTEFLRPSTGVRTSLEARPWDQRAAQWRL